jgi:hypothetical protein
LSAILLFPVTTTLTNNGEQSPVAYTACNAKHVLVTLFWWVLPGLTKKERNVVCRMPVRDSPDVIRQTLVCRRWTNEDVLVVVVVGQCPCWMTLMNDTRSRMPPSYFVVGLLPLRHAFDRTRTTSTSTMTMTNPAPTQSPSDEQGVSFSVSTKCGARNCDTITKIVLLIYVPRKMPITLFSGAIALLIDINP